MSRYSRTWKLGERNRALLTQEAGTVVKDWGGRFPVALIYSNSYAVGMSSLGFQTIYHLLNSRPDVVCERVFDDGLWDEAPAPLSLESQKTLDDFALWAFSIAFELDYLHVANLIRRGGVSPLAAERSDTDPILIAGGIAPSANPGPLAPIFDAFFVGEAEESLKGLIEAIAADYGDRDRVLNKLACLPGLYVPAVHDHLPGWHVQRQWLRDLDRYPTHSVIWSRKAEFGDMHLVEVTRGCRHGCRFCLAGHFTRPWRERSVDVVMAAVEAGQGQRDKVGLVGATISDYSDIEELLSRLKGKGIRISVSSLRVDSASPALLEMLAWSGSQTLTVAPEAGTERLRRLIGKGLTDRKILQLASLAGEKGFAQLKLYFMLGLPGETDEDVAGLIDLVGQIAGRFSRGIVVNITPFVPKLHTPFEGESIPDVKLVARRLKELESRLRGRQVQVRSESPEWAQVQAILSLGDPSLARALVSLRRPTLAEWARSLKAGGLEEQILACSQGGCRPAGLPAMDC